MSMGCGRPQEVRGQSHTDQCGQRVGGQKP